MWMRSTHPDGDFLTQRSGPAAAATAGARHPASATAGAAANVAVGPARAHALREAGALAPRALRQLAVCLIDL